MCEALFYYYATQRDINRMLVTYLDHREVFFSTTIFQTIFFSNISYN